MVKLNQRNPEVHNDICDVIRFWVSEFDVDGIRLDAADVLDFDLSLIHIWSGFLLYVSSRLQKEHKYSDCYIETLFRVFP